MGIRKRRCRDKEITGMNGKEKGGKKDSER